MPANRWIAGIAFIFIEFQILPGTGKNTLAGNCLANLFELTSDFRHLYHARQQKLFEKT